MRDLSHFSPIMRKEIFNIAIDVLKDAIDYTIILENSDAKLGTIFKDIFEETVNEIASDFEKDIRIKKLEMKRKLVDSQWLKGE